MNKKCKHVWEIKSIKGVIFTDPKKNIKYYDVIFFCKKCFERKDDVIKSYPIK